MNSTEEIEGRGEESRQRIRDGKQKKKKKIRELVKELQYINNRRSSRKQQRRWRRGIIKGRKREGREGEGKRRKKETSLN